MTHTTSSQKEVAAPKFGEASGRPCCFPKRSDMLRTPESRRCGAVPLHLDTRLLESRCPLAGAALGTPGPMSFPG